MLTNARLHLKYHSIEYDYRKICIFTSKFRRTETFFSNLHLPLIVEMGEKNARYTTSLGLFRVPFRVVVTHLLCRNTIRAVERYGSISLCA